MNELRISIGQYSSAGRKELNQDSLGVKIPKPPLLHSKGIAIALADGISSSPVSQQASDTAVASFLEDYYCTPDAWSVKKSAQQVLRAINSWLYSQTRRSQYHYDFDRGFVCTFSAMIIKSTTAYIFHVGDSRIYRLHQRSMEQLTQDHRIRLSELENYLSRALGFHQQLDLDYQSFSLEPGDWFVLASDGVYEYIDATHIHEALQSSNNDLDAAARHIVDQAYQLGSEDNLSIQLLRIDSLPQGNVDETLQQRTTLPFPPILEPRMSFDGYRIVRQLHISDRSHVYLAVDTATETTVVIKTPSLALREHPGYLERFLLEEWIARRIDNSHVLKAYEPTRPRNAIYIVMEYISGQTLQQWLTDHPNPALETVRDIVDQLVRGLRAFHRLEMLHQDLRPENIMIDQTGTVKIIDFGSVWVAGLSEDDHSVDQDPVPGAIQYAAPEYFLGDGGSVQSDLFALGVICYQLLSGKLPYGASVARIHNRMEQRRLKYRPLAFYDDLNIPIWVDETIRKAVHPEAGKRYQELSEFSYDLRHPNKHYLRKQRAPLLERDPVLFWQILSVLLCLVIVFLLIK